MTLTKPAPWAWAGGGVASSWQTLAAAVKLLVPAWEGTGHPKELVSGSTMTRPASVTWATQDGMPVLRFSGAGDGLHTPAPVLGQSTAWTILCVLRAPVAVAEMALYSEVGAGGTDASYTEPLYLPDAGISGGLASDTWALVTDPQELFVGHDGPGDAGWPLDLTGFRVLVGRRVGNVLTLWADGLLLATHTAGLEDNIVVPVPALGLIGISTTSGADFIWSPFAGDLASMALWDTARSDAEVLALSADPFGLITQAPVTARRSACGRNARRLALGMFR